MQNEKTVIVGAGVAGLSLAILLAQRGMESVVLESRQSFDGPTSGVRISAAGVEILNAIGVDSIGESTHQLAMHFGGRSVRFTVPNDGASAVIATRLALHEKLMARAQTLGVKVVTGFEVARAAETADGVELTSGSGERVVGKWMVGADGVGSAMRRALNPDQGSTKTYAGYLGVGFITEDPAKIEMALHRYPGQQVGLASCGKASAAAKNASVFMWTHIHMPEAEAKLATRASVEAKLARRSASWSAELNSKYQLYTRDPHAILSFGPVYNGKPPAKWYGDKAILCGDAAHPYGPGGQGISMALKDAKALCEVIARGFKEDDKRAFQQSRAQEARARGEAAEKRNAQEPSSTRWGLFAQALVMKTVALLTRGKLRF